jgi:hypothetical protein
VGHLVGSDCTSLFRLGFGLSVYHIFENYYLKIMKIIYFFIWLICYVYANKDNGHHSRPVRLLTKKFKLYFKLFFGHMEVAIGNSFKVGAYMSNNSWREMFGSGDPLIIRYSGYKQGYTFDFVSNPVCFTSKSDKEIVDLIRDNIYPYFNSMRNNCNLIAFQIAKLLCPNVNLAKKFPFFRFLRIIKSLGIQFPRATENVHAKTIISKDLANSEFGKTLLQRI